MTSPILVPTDGSPESERALDVALPLATALDRPLCCLWAWEGLHGLEVDLAAATVEEITTQEVADRGERLRGLIARRITSADVACDYRTPIGAPGAAIIAAAADVSARYIVMAPHGRSGFKRWRLGSVADRVVQTSDVPVVMLRPEEDGGRAGAIRRILVPLDGSPLATTALEEAMPVALACGASLLLLRSVTPFAPMEMGLAEANVASHRCFFRAFASPPSQRQ